MKHKVVRGDTLWDLAQHYYKDPYQWPKIREANPPPNVHDPHWIYPKQFLIIPDLEQEPAETAEPVAVEADMQPVQTLAETPVQPVKKKSFAGSLSDSLSTKIPPGMTGQAISMSRVKLPQDWKPEGKILEPQEEVTVAVQGDPVRVFIESEDVRKGTRYRVLRPASPTEADQDSEAFYAVNVGLIEIRKPIADLDRVYSAVVVQSADTIQSEDVLRREE